ncbi:MAG TPA: aspartate aminotransferase family protein [Elusimicrobia bacterium]|nr:MAG: glutamate-1-semialdehyde 2,1-aminomutase [Candidatus Rokubacteria bacterium GWA2_70_23]OGK88386.1 MAG: glutamate-1-semialdehyde 2,1-aminomutase [Candidatus Rokubacteria bacterium GWC2_70_24]HBL18321.1 aspartate aminotransferase family protein [Elusimicrobiota bacterium]
MAETTRTRSARETELLERAKRRLPGGVLGTARYAADAAFIVKRGTGSKIYDVSGREYIDYVLASGPLILGHAHPAVVAAVREQIEGGSTYYMVNEPIIQLAEEICRAMPCAEQVRFTSTGSEATFFALRVARTFRKRDKILKFEGGYHGAHDYGMMSSAPRSPKAFPAPVPDSSGIPHSIEAEVLIAPYNDLGTVEGIIAAHADELAAVIVEPFQRLVPPQPGFLQGLREITRRHGVLLVFDEVVTGFRLAYGGAQEYYGVVPDLAAIGKIVGGGFPLAAVCGAEELMRPFDPQYDGTGDFISQSGTLNGNPIAAVAGLATLAELRKPGAYDTIHGTGKRLMAGLTELAQKAGLPAQVVGEPVVFDLLFTDEPVVDYRSLQKADGARGKAFTTELIKRGVVKNSQKMYVSLVHSAEDVATTLQACEDALKALPKMKASA